MNTLGTSRVGEAYAHGTTEISGGKKPKVVKWKCAACGYEHESKEAWETCPLCFAKQGMVMLHLKDE